MHELIKKKKFSFILVIILALALPISVFLVGLQTGYLSRALLSSEPKNLRITNLSDNSFTISWKTNQKTLGFVSYGETESLGETALDERESTKRESRFTHHVTLKNLDGEKLYFFKINSGSDSFDNNGKPFSQKTAPIASDPPPLAETVFGKVISSEGIPTRESIVYLNIPGATTLSTYSKEGNWLITLNNARMKDLSTFYTLQEGDKIQISVTAAEGTASVFAENKNLNPVSDIKLKAPPRISVNIAGFISSFGSKKGSSEYNETYDVNSDGKINALDWSSIIKNKTVAD